MFLELYCFFFFNLIKFPMVCVNLTLILFIFLGLYFIKYFPFLFSICFVKFNIFFFFFFVPLEKVKFQFQRKKTKIDYYSYTRIDNCNNIYYYWCDMMFFSNNRIINFINFIDWKLYKFFNLYFIINLFNRIYIFLEIFELVLKIKIKYIWNE